MQKQKIVLENKRFSLTLGEDCTAESLLVKATNEECLAPSEPLPLFLLTEDRPYNNEIKLSHPTKRTTFKANRVRKEGNRLIVGFELITFEAVIELKITDSYIAFSLIDFIIKPEDFDGLDMSPPPVAEFCLLQLPIKKREHLGKWLGVTWDKSAAVSILGSDPFVRVDFKEHGNTLNMSADALRDFKLKGCDAALIASTPDALMDLIDEFEKDYNLPRGVQSRRKNEYLNSSIYWVQNADLQNIDMHIKWAKQAGCRMMLFFYKSIFKSDDSYASCGNYRECDFRDTYPNGFADLRTVLKRVKDSGIIAGLHFLHTHIGLESRYITPNADHRLNMTRQFTLSKPLSESDDVIYVEQNPSGCVMHEKCRVLKFGGELISYESYQTERPYCFTGCKRGSFNTKIKSHDIGTVGGILDISEYGATSVYVDQTTSLQDEIADELARVYDCGFEFAYFDGSEGTNSPFDINVPYAQHRVYKRLNPPPIFCEGAAKSHFSWHMLSGGNAFDIFPMNVFKEKIAQFPLEEAARMADDFTRVNFGWWQYTNDTMPDIYEYGTSKAAAWDCPATVMANPGVMQSNPRTRDNLEVLRRWEDVRARHLLTDSQKAALRDPDAEYTLLIDEKGEYELVPYRKINTDAAVSAFYFERKGKHYVVCWHTQNAADFSLELNPMLVSYTESIGGAQTDIKRLQNNVVIPIKGKRYLCYDGSKEELIAAFEKATAQII